MNLYRGLFKRAMDILAWAFVVLRMGIRHSSPKHSSPKALQSIFSYQKACFQEIVCTFVV